MHPQSVRAAVAWIALVAGLGSCAGSDPSRLPKVPTPGPTVGVGDPLHSDTDPVLLDLGGAAHEPLSVGVAQAHVLLFVTTDCPIANGYAPEVRRLVRDYAPRGVQFFLVHVYPGLEAEEARVHAADYDLPGPVLIDRDHVLVEAVGATHTPEAAVLVAGAAGSPSRLAYLGRIDDLYADLGVKRPAGPNRRDLRLALDQVLAGTPIEVARTAAVGCTIPER